METKAVALAPQSQLSIPVLGHQAPLQSGIFQVFPITMVLLLEQARAGLLLHGGSESRQQTSTLLLAILLRLRYHHQHRIVNTASMCGEEWAQQTLMVPPLVTQWSVYRFKRITHHKEEHSFGLILVQFRQPQENPGRIPSSTVP